MGGHGTAALPASSAGAHPDAGEDSDDAEAAAYAARLGRRLRSVRRGLGYTLADVERISRGRIRAGALGSYERGERSIRVSMLKVVSDIYGTAFDQLLPRWAAPTEHLSCAGGVTVDLAVLRSAGPALGGPLAAYADVLLSQRNAGSAPHLTVDMQSLAQLAVLYRSSDRDLLARLAMIGSICL